MISISNFTIGAIVSFGSLCIAAWFGDRSKFLDIILLLIALFGVPCGMIIACCQKNDASKQEEVAQ